MSLVRLHVVLARAGVASRRSAEAMITAGRVKVNGAIVSEVGAKIDPAVDRVMLDDKEIGEAEPPVTIVLNKPAAVLSTLDDPRGRESVRDLVQAEPYKLRPVGRLDYHTEGVLLMTTDGELANRLLHPSHHVPKTYMVKVGGRPTEGALEKLRAGVELEDGVTRPAVVDFLEHEGANSWLEVIVTEGRNRLVRRMCEAVDHRPLRVVRTGFATISAGELRPGEYRYLSRAELGTLYSVAGLAVPEERVGARPEESGEVRLGETRRRKGRLPGEERAPRGFEGEGEGEGAGGERGFGRRSRRDDEQLELPLSADEELERGRDERPRRLGRGRPRDGGEGRAFGGDRPRRSFARRSETGELFPGSEPRRGRDRGFGERKSFGRDRDERGVRDDRGVRELEGERADRGPRERKPFRRGDDASPDRRSRTFGERKPFSRGGDDREPRERRSFRREGEFEAGRSDREPRERKSFRRDGDDRGTRERKSFSRGGDDRGTRERKSFSRGGDERGSFGERKSFRRGGDERGTRDERKRPLRKPGSQERSFGRGRDERGAGDRSSDRGERTFGERKSFGRDRGAPRSGGRARGEPRGGGRAFGRDRGEPRSGGRAFARGRSEPRGGARGERPDRFRARTGRDHVERPDRVDRVRADRDSPRSKPRSRSRDRDREPGTTPERSRGRPRTRRPERGRDRDDD